MVTHAAIPLPHRSSAGWPIYAAIAAWLAALAIGCRLCLPEQGRDRELVDQASQGGRRTRT